MNKNLKKLISKSSVAGLCTLTLLSSTASIAFANTLNEALPSVSMIAATSSSQSGLYIIQSTPLHSTETVITGNLPNFTNIEDKAFSDEVNGIVSKFYDDTIDKVKALKTQGVNPTVNFSYTVTGDSKYLSVIMHSSINPGNTASDDVKTIVLDQNSYKLYSLLDILGPNGYKVANKYISDQIKANPDYYLKSPEGFNGANSATNFYIDNGRNLVIIFSKYEISPGYVGNPEFKINLDEYKNIGLPPESFFSENNITMVPLDKSAIFGQTVKLINKSCANITYGKIKYSIKAYVNNYNGKKLETAPVLKNNVLYVPVSYYEQLVDTFYNVSPTVVTLSKLMNSN